MTRAHTAGFSLVEVLITLAIALVAAGAVLGLTYPAHLVFETEPERADVQQRLRLAIDSLTKDLMMAGAGGDERGSSIRLGLTFASIQPLRRGLRAADLPGSFHDDRISVVYVPYAAAYATLREPAASTAIVEASPEPGCPISSPLCRFHVNRLIAVYDGSGAFDAFRLRAVESAPPRLVGDGSPLSKTYAAGATIVEVEAATYWIRIDARSGRPQLTRYDGQQTDSPIADNVLGLRFEYFGEPRPPALVRALTDPIGPWTSYGPTPPPVNVDDPATPGYGPGENCAFAVAGGAAIPRPELQDLGSASTGLVRLDPASLVDGPWCPDPGSPNRFDADLLRVRRVRVAIRVGASRSLVFARIPDIVTSFDVGVRNLQP